MSQYFIKPSLLTTPIRNFIRVIPQSRTNDQWRLHSNKFAARLRLRSLLSTKRRWNEASSFLGRDFRRTASEILSPSCCVSASPRGTIFVSVTDPRKIFTGELTPSRHSSRPHAKIEIHPRRRTLRGLRMSLTKDEGRARAFRGWNSRVYACVIRFVRSGVVVNY